MKFLFQKIDNSQLTIFRIFYGLIIFFECAGAIAIGWTKEVFDTPQAAFSFIGFEFLEVINLQVAYVLYSIMALLGLFVAFGYRYRLSTILLAVIWTTTYLAHKAHYNNHHYLMFLLNWLFVFVPAHQYRSLDVKQGRTEEKNWCYKWNVFLFIGLLFIAYTYASIAKMYPDWIRGVPLKQWLSGKVETPIIGFIYKSELTAYFMAWGGLVFDLLVIPFMLWKKTRKVTFVIAIFFHLSNSLTFQIGTFPYTMIASSVLFFPTKTIQRIFFKKKTYFETTDGLNKSSKQHQLVFALLISFFTIQTLLPLRHHLIEDSVYWTEEGHRLSWRMMLRAKSGDIRFIIYKNGERVYHDVYKDLSKQQLRLLKVKTDVMWQYTQRLKKQYGEENLEIYIESKVMLNDHPYNVFIKPRYNMVEAKWNYFGHCEWLEPFKGWKQPKN